MNLRTTILSLGLFIFTHSAISQTYTYKVRYGLVQAGKAQLVHTIEEGRLNSFFSIESSPWLSKLWTLSDSIHTEYELASEKLIRHRKAIHEGNYHRNYTVTFADSNQAVVNGNPKSIVTHELKDIPSLLYHLSNSRFNHGDTLNFLVWDGRGSGTLMLLVEKIGKPTLFKPFNEPGWRLTPLNSTRKSRANQIRLSMLYSRAYPHIPLRIEIDTKYGSVQMRKEG